MITNNNIRKSVEVDLIEVVATLNCCANAATDYVLFYFLSGNSISSLLDIILYTVYC